MAEFLKKYSRFLSADALTLSLYSLLFIYIPCHYRYHKLVHHFSKKILAYPFNFPMFFEKMVYYSISDVFIILLIIVSIFARRLSFARFTATPHSKALLSFFFVAFISIALSNHNTFALQYYRLLQLFICSLIFYLVSEVRLSIKDSSLTLLFALCSLAGSLFQSVVAIVQYFGQKALGLKRLGELSLTPESSPSSIFSQDGSLWVFDHLFSSGYPKLIIRAFGTLPDPNILGGFMALSVISSLYLFFRVNHRYRLFFLPIFFIQIFTLYITYSRSAFFALLLAISSYLLLRCKQNSSQKESSKKAAIYLACAFVIGGALFYPQLFSRGGYVNYGGTGASFSDSERVVYQKIAINMMEKRPFWGVGFNNYILEMQTYAPKDLPARYSHPVHNIFLLIGAETGLIGLALFSFIFFGLAFSILRRPLIEERVFLLSTASLIFLIGLCSHYYLSWQSGRLMLFISLGLMARFARKDEILCSI